MNSASWFTRILLVGLIALGLGVTPRTASAVPNVQACLDGCARDFLIDMAACGIGCGISGPGYVACFAVCSGAAFAHSLNCSYGCKHPNGIAAPTDWNPSSEDLVYPYHAGEVIPVNFGRLLEGTTCDFESGQGTVTEANFYLMDLTAIPPEGFPEETPFDNLPWISLGVGVFDGDRFWSKSLNMAQHPSQRGFVLRCDFAVPGDTAMYHALTAMPKIPEPVTVSGHITCDNQAMIFTSNSAQPGMALTHRTTACWSNSVPVNFTTTDRYIYIAAWSDNNTGQGLLHDLSITQGGPPTPVYSGNSLWTVAPGDSDVAGCDMVISPVQIGGAMASRIPTANFVPTANGCFNPAVGQPSCYAIWGRVASINDGARWTWYNSGNQVSPDAPFKPGFNHRELLIFRLDTYALNNTVGVEPGVMGNTMRLRAYPNPTLGSSRLEFSLSEESDANLTVYDVVGRKIATITNGRLSAGTHNLTWDGRNSTGARVGPGTYFVRLQAGAQRMTSSVLILQ